MKATLKTAIGIADMFPPLYRRAIVEAMKKKHNGQNVLDFHRPSYKYWVQNFFVESMWWGETKELTYWAAFSLWWDDPEKHPFPPPHPSWEQRFPTEWKQYHGQEPYQF